MSRGLGFTYLSVSVRFLFGKPSSEIREEVAEPSTLGLSAGTTFMPNLLVFAASPIQLEILQTHAEVIVSQSPTFKT